MRLADLSGCRVAVWGIGAEGQAALTALQALVPPPAGIVLVDDGPAGPVDAASGVLTGAPGRSALAGADVVIRSPGISVHGPVAQELLANGVKLVGGTHLYLAETGGSRVVAVTGSKGKSTTASLIAALLRAVGEDVELGGNIGRAPLGLLGTRADHVVLEVSSFQAADVDTPPEVGVLTALFPDHLDWHGSTEAYFTDKLVLFGDECSGGLVANGADPTTVLRLGGRTDVRWYATEATLHPDANVVHDGGLELLSLSGLQLAGLHNHRNVCAALTALRCCGIDLARHAHTLETALSAFVPLPHRLQRLAVIGGVEWVDDGLATTPHAAIAAVEAFPSRPVTLLLGGHERGLDYTPLVQFLAGPRSAPVAVLSLPDNGPRIAAELRATAGTAMTVHDCPDLAEAVTRAASITPPGGVVLLSPAASSFGRYANYLDRSRAFAALVDRLGEPNPQAQS